MQTVRGRRRSRYERTVKPMADRVVALGLLVLAAPLFVTVALVVRLSLGSPVIFAQRRIGAGGGSFVVYKFRTMTADRRRRREPTAVERRATHKSLHDPRLTPVGRLLRRWSLDELPQLWNVVNGTMSLVGPRPELVEIVETYEPWQHRRHAVRPGLTGLWQIRGRGDVVMHEATALDLEYVDSVSPWTDLRILLQTIPAVLGRRKGH